MMFSDSTNSSEGTFWCDATEHALNTLPAITLPKNTFTTPNTKSLRIWATSRRDSLSIPAVGGMRWGHVSGSS